MKEVLYLSFDSLKEGVGASQVLAYMRKVLLFTKVTIVSFEKEMPTESELLEIEMDGLKWMPLPFGNFGVLGGVNRVFRMWMRIDRSKIIHARSTLPGLAALLRFPTSWVWDCRSLQADQKRALSVNKRVNFVFLTMRLIEYALAKKSSAIIAITHAVVPVFVSRFSISKNKIRVIPTCVDVRKFQEEPFKKSGEIKILFAGTFSPAYDIDLTNKIIERLKEHLPVMVTIATSSGSTDLWKDINYNNVISVHHSQMPKLIQEHDLGISIWKNDLGICLTSVSSTKTAEFLACGRPVIINSLQGDFGNLIKVNSTGVVTSSGSEMGIQDYAKQVLSLVQDDETPNRCRQLALQEFDLDKGVKVLIDLYKGL